MREQKRSIQPGDLVRVRHRIAKVEGISFRVYGGEAMILAVLPDKRGLCFQVRMARTGRIRFVLREHFALHRSEPVHRLHGRRGKT